MARIGGKALAQIAERIRHRHVEAEEIGDAACPVLLIRGLQAVDLDVECNRSRARIRLVEIEERIEIHHAIADRHVMGDLQHAVLITGVGLYSKSGFRRRGGRLSLSRLLFGRMMPPAAMPGIFMDSLFDTGKAFRRAFPRRRSHAKLV